MKKSTLAEFRASLLATGAYETPAACRPKKVRKPSWLTTLGFTISSFGVFPRCSIAQNFGTLNQEKWASICYDTIRKAESYGSVFTAEGWKNRESYKGPVVYLSNHMSTLETIILPFVLNTYGPISTVVKQSLAHLPGLEVAAKTLKLIPIGRANPREDLMTIFEQGQANIKEGYSVLIFAQGTRVPVFARKGWSSIGTKLAEKAGVPVIPIAVKTDLQVTRPGSKGWAKDFGTVDPSRDVRVACGPVLTGSSREMHKASFDWIAAKVASWGLPVEE